MSDVATELRRPGRFRKSRQLLAERFRLSDLLLDLGAFEQRNFDVSDVALEAGQSGGFLEACQFLAELLPEPDLLLDLSALEQRDLDMPDVAQEFRCRRRFLKAFQFLAELLPEPDLLLHLGTLEQGNLDVSDIAFETREPRRFFETTQFLAELLRDLELCPKLSLIEQRNLDRSDIAVGRSEVPDILEELSEHRMGGADLVREIAEGPEIDRLRSAEKIVVQVEHHVAERVELPVDGFQRMDRLKGAVREVVQRPAVWHGQLDFLQLPRDPNDQRAGIVEEIVPRSPCLGEPLDYAFACAVNEYLAEPVRNPAGYIQRVRNRVLHERRGLSGPLPGHKDWLPRRTDKISEVILCALDLCPDLANELQDRIVWIGLAVRIEKRGEVLPVGDEELDRFDDRADDQRAAEKPCGCRCGPEGGREGARRCSRASECGADGNDLRDRECGDEGDRGGRGKVDVSSDGAEDIRQPVEGASQ